MRRKYEITNNNPALASPRGEGRDEGGGGEGDGKRRRTRGATGRDGKRKKDEEITEGRIEKKRKDVRESRIKVDQLHVQIAHTGPWPALPSLWGSLLPDYMKLG